jgi:hypothetical protein
MGFTMSTSTEILTLKQAIEMVPGKVRGAASMCGVSPRAVYKWISTGRLPRTDYTGETNYAGLLAKASGGQFTADDLLELAKPHHAAA